MFQFIMQVIENAFLASYSLNGQEYIHRLLDEDEAIPSEEPINTCN